MEMEQGRMGNGLSKRKSGRLQFKGWEWGCQKMMHNERSFSPVQNIFFLPAAPIGRNVHNGIPGFVSS